MQLVGLKKTAEILKAEVENKEAYNIQEFIFCMRARMITTLMKSLNQFVIMPIQMVSSKKMFRVYLELNSGIGY